MKHITRKNFLFGGLSLAAVAAFFKWGNKPEKKKTIKFLTQDGKLVEIDADKLPVTKRLASKADIQNWVKPNKPL
jgi:hypothetical protein